jgi:AcrR family transcriptional regulator
MGRPNQKSRTRKDLLQAAARLMRQGHRPSLEDIAEEALVSRATAYRYFPNVEALLTEASLDIAFPNAEGLFDDLPADDPVARLFRVDAALDDMILANEPSLRLMLAHTVTRGLRAEDDADLPVRQNRRTPLIEAALKPARQQFKPAALDALIKILALIIGTESRVVFKDVLQTDEREAQRVKRWAIRALVEAAQKPRAKAP